MEELTWRFAQEIIELDDNTGLYLVAHKTQAGNYVYSGPPVTLNYIKENRHFLYSSKFLGPLPKID